MLTIIIPEEGETWGRLSKRLREISGEAVVILPSADELLPRRDDNEMRKFFNACSENSGRVFIATHKKFFQSAFESKNIRVLKNVSELKSLVGGHPKLQEAMRVLSPGIWKQQIRSHLQSLGLLSLPKLRVYALILASGGMLFFVLFKLMPSAQVQVWPKSETVNQTANIFLVESGATVNMPPRVKLLELVPVKAQLKKQITFDRISKNFVGGSAIVEMTIINKSGESYSLRKGSRLANQAGMVFEIEEPVFIEQGREITVKAKAQDEDLYGEIIGERGNVPAGLKWYFPGLSETERQMIFGENREPARGGTTAFTHMLSGEDIALAEKQLKQDLVSSANQMIDEQLLIYNEENSDKYLDRLYYDEFTLVAFSGVTLPVQFIGEEVNSVPIEGSIEFTAFAYDKKKAMDILKEDIKGHVSENKFVIEDSITLSRLIHHVIDYSDDLSWIKLTVDLSANEQYILDPLSPAGAHFAMNLRGQINGRTKDEALRIVKNMTEVENASISLWPPWSRRLPEIPSHITITPNYSSE